MCKHFQNTDIGVSKEITKKLVKEVFGNFTKYVGKYDDYDSNYNTEKVTQEALELNNELNRTDQIDNITLYVDKSADDLKKFPKGFADVQYIV